MEGRKSPDVWWPTQNLKTDARIVRLTGGFNIVEAAVVGDCWSEGGYVADTDGAADGFFRVWCAGWRR